MLHDSGHKLCQDLRQRALCKGSSQWRGYKAACAGESGPDPVGSYHPCDDFEFYSECVGKQKSSMIQFMPFLLIVETLLQRATVGNVDALWERMWRYMEKRRKEL